MQRFTIPRDIYFGENAIDQLREVEGEKAIIVIGSKRLINDGTVLNVQANLMEAGIESIVYSGIENDPTIEMVKAGVAKMNEYKPDLIVAIGGGSPIDAAKSMWIFYEHPELTFEEATKPFSLPTLRNKAKFIAISTTSGTATEVTSFSVIADNETGIKYPIADYNVTPDIAILDTNLVQSLPKGLVANTGMDALTHAIEAYVSTARNPITDALAMKSMEMINENLQNSYEGNIESRNNMHIAQSLAGMAFSNAILGIVHSMAHKTGRLFSVPHGLANAIYLAQVIQFNAKGNEEAFADIARRLGLKGNTNNELVESLVQLVKDFKKNLNMATSLKEAGVSQELFDANLDLISREAVGDPCTGTNPRSVSVEEMKKLFIAVYNGEDVNF